MVDSNRTPGFFTSIYKAGLAGGLYTQASPLSVPEGFSPAMENVFLNDRNNIRTRYGTQELIADVGTNTYIYVVRTQLGTTFLLAKRGLDLVVYNIRELQPKELDIALLESFTNVWSAEAEFSIPSFTTLQPRVLITTARNTPVFVRFTERRVINRTASAVLIVTLPGEFTGVAAEVKVFRDGVLLDPSSYTFSGDQVILDQALTGNFYIVHVGWYWCTEATVHYGFQVSQTVSRFNTGPSDLSLVTPIELLVGTTPVPADKDRLPISLFKNSQAAAKLTYTNPPTLEEQFTFSGGSFRTTANIQKVLPGITHVTFGAVNPVETDISELTFIRGIDLRKYNGGSNLPINRISVFVDDTASTLHSGAAVAGAYGSRYKAFLTNYITEVSDNATPASYIDYSATENVGLVYGAISRVVRSGTEPFGSNFRFIGSAAVAGTSLPYATSSRGSWWPLYGLQEHADFLNNSFPSIAELHENRLVLSGFANDPGRLVLSAVLDTTVTGDIYSDFQIAEQEGLDVNAVVLDVNTQDSGGITAVKSASGQLFVFTLNGVYIVSGGERGITPTSKFVTQIAGVGAVNSRCVVVVNNSILFLGRSGIYGLAQSFDAAGGWRVQLISEPINDKLTNSVNVNVAWMTFLPNDDVLYVCVAEEGSTMANELYLWKQDSNMWSKFSDYTGFWRATSGSFTDLTQNYFVSVKDNRLISYPYRYPIDQFTGTASPLTFADYVVRQVQDLPFKMIPDVGVHDVGTVGLITTTKLNSTQVFIDSDDPTGSFVYPNAVTSDLVVVYTQEGARKSTVTYDIETGLVGTVTDTDRVGFIYKCFATTPNLFVASDKPDSYLPSNKSVHTCYFVFHTNGEYRKFGVNLKKVDTDPTQVTPLNQFPSFDSSEVVAFDAAVLDAARQLVRPFWKIAIHPGGIEDFYQMIILSDSITEWELVSLQTTVSQSSVRPGVGRI